MIGDELVDDLVQQCLDLLDGIGEPLQRWRRRGSLEGDELQRILRALHTVKGSFGFLGQSAVAGLAHALEDLVVDVRDMLINGTPALAATVIEGCGVLRDLVVDPERAEKQPPTALVTRLRQARERVPAVAADDDDDPFAEFDADLAATPVFPLEPDVEQGRRALRLGARLLRIELEIGRDVDAHGSTLLDLNDMLLVLGDPLVVAVDDSGIEGLADCLQRDLSCQILLMTTSDVADCAALLELAPERFTELDLRPFIPQQYRTQRIMRGGAAGEVGGRGGLKVLLQAMGAVAEDLAGRVGKRVRVEIHTVDRPLGDAPRQALQGALTHLLRNAVDHGIEAEQVRSATGKPSVGRIVIEADESDGLLALRVRDDGAGIDPRAVAERARARGLISDPAPYADDPAKAFDLIFLPGFSTAAAVTELSGRGVGLDVVRSAVDGLGGKVAVESRVGGGTAVTLRLPSARLA